LTDIEDSHTPIESEGTDSDTDLDDLAINPMESVAQFTAVLCEAQHIAIQLERKEKKRPKTYHGNSRTTQYRHKKAQNALASQGFRDISSFFLKGGSPSEQVQGEHRSDGSPGMEPESGCRCEADGGDRVLAPSEALEPVPLAVAERQSQRQCLALTEEDKNSPGSDLVSGSDQGEAHWHHQLPASLKALVPALLAVSG